VSHKVSLWPADEDAFCDCGSAVEPCAHIAAAISALKNDFAVSEDKPSTKRLVRYAFAREGKSLRLDRRIGDEKITQSLASLVGGIQSGRISGSPIEATQDDFAIDQLVGLDASLEILRPGWAKLWPFLKSVSESQPGGLAIDGTPVEIGAPLPKFRVRMKTEGKNLRLTLVSPDGVNETFSNGPALFGSALRLHPEDPISENDRNELAPPGRLFSPSEFPKLMGQVLPELYRRYPVDRDSDNIPEASEAPPRIVLRMERGEGGELSVVPTVEYPAPYPLKDRAAEARLGHQIETQLRMVAGRRSLLRGEAALEFLRTISADPTIEKRGGGADEFPVESELSPAFEIDGDSFTLSFRTASGRTADAEATLASWRRGQGFVDLLEGGFAPFPAAWLDEYGSALERLYALRGKNKKLPAYARPILLELASDTGTKLGDSLRALKSAIETGDSTAVDDLPSDLRADLRNYQRTGVGWLRRLTDSGMGALLADDMGLGKTLQAISVVRGRTLVVAPKSVIHAWKDQLALFRPGLIVATFEGASRTLDPKIDVTLVTYGLLRMEAAAFESVEWDLIVIDEAQTIKNPDSQIAAVVHRLRGRARIALTGTPVENRLDDLWSQFEFLNPGLLGSRAEFRREFADPIAQGNAAAAKRFRRRVRTFILRRLKSEVAPELPEKTEVVVRCELTPEERALYTALLNSTRKEVVAKLDAGASALSILEVLLRLRQACCHPSLVPGQSAPTSSKLELLVESLEKSLALGHRALVFSQWTSFLDLIEPRLREGGITFDRLDGATTNREEIVRKFQAADGASVLLLSLKAGGVGITLTAADHVYLMDGWWNPAVERQAADRAHRIGQLNPVLLTRILAEDTIEERIFALQEKKRALSDTILSGDLASGSITREDLIELLAL
jgi:superfamily II DNA or RNA helicase